MGSPIVFLRGLLRIRFVRDLLTMQTGSLLLMGAGLLSSVMFARLLGKDSYGLYVVIVAFAGTAGAFFNIGQGQSLYVFFSESYARRDKGAMAAVLANFLFVAVCNIVLLGLLALIMPIVSMKFYGSPDIGNAARILCFFQMTEIGNSMTLILLQSLRRIRLKIVLEQAANISYLTLAIVVLVMGGKITAVLLTQLAVSAFFLPVSLVVLSIIARQHTLPGIREVVRVPWSKSRQYLAQGLIITVDKTIGNFFPQGLFFAFSLFVPAAFVGVARIAVQLANIPRSILLPQAGDLSTPALAVIKTQGISALRKTSAKVIKHALAFQALMTLGAAFVFPPIIFYLYGPEYRDAIPLMLGLLPIMLLGALGIVNSPLLRLYRRTEWSIAAGFLNWTCMLSAMFVLLRFFSPATTFLSVYFIGQAVPLLLTLYVFLFLLRQPKVQTA
jgi:O-antigen/teichoic acid export membrane protein